MLESLFNKAASLKDWNFIKKTPTQVFSCEMCKTFKNVYTEEHLRTTASDYYLFLQFRCRSPNIRTIVNTRFINKESSFKSQ